MSAAEARNSDDKKTPPEKSTVVLLFSIVADTTWRMFFPIIGGTVLGIWADHSFGTKPWLTVGFVTVGVVISGLLVRIQMKKTYNKS